MANPGITPNSLKHTQNTKISWYDNLNGSGESEIDLFTLFRLIRYGGDSHSIIMKIREATNPSIVNRLKRKLPVVTPSGLFDGSRKSENLDRYSGFICLDFDKVRNLENAKNFLILDPFTYSVFVSPSGKGLKLFVKVSCDKDGHKVIFNSLYYYYFKKYGLECDKGCKDIPRLMFISYDPDLFHNEMIEIKKILSVD